MAALRPYQAEAVAGIESQWGCGNRRTLLCLATGTGKTIVMAEMARRDAVAGGRTLLLAHRGELLDQAADKLYSYAGIRCGVEKGAERCEDPWPVVVGSVQSMCRDARLARYAPDAFSLVMVDEAHHSASGSYRAVLEHFPNAKVLGVTATPDRSDRKGLAEVFDSIAYEYGMASAVRDGYLVPIRALQMPVEIDLTGVRSQAGDWSAADLGSRLDPMLREIARAMVGAGCRGRKSVAFLPLCATSERFARILEEEGLSAAHVDGNSPDRAQVLADFDAGRYDVLCNAMLLTEGWDCPSVDCVVPLRATKSRALYCLDEETEVLTRDGWKKDVGVGEDVLAFDMATGRTEFTPTLAKVRRPLGPDEFFCSLKGQSSDIRVTDRHRMIYDNKRRTGWKIKEAQELADLRSGAYLPVSGHGDFPGVPLTDDELTFIGWVMTDGSINKANNAITITQGEHHADYCEEITTCIEACGFKYTKTKARRNGGHWNEHGDLLRWTISKGNPRGRDKDKTGWGRLEPWLSKDLSPALFDMTERQFAVMLEAVYHGDGNKSNRLSYHIGKGNKTFIERLQAMGVQRGYRASVSIEKAGGSRKRDLYMLHIKKREFVKVGDATGKHARWIKEPHSNESCWCVETKLGTVVTRRNGKVAIVGNCQMVGRGTRLSPETGKRDLLLLDFLWQATSHDLCRPASLVAASPQVAKAMGARLDGGEEMDLLELEGLAERDVVAEREESLARELEEKRRRKARFVDPLQYAMSIEAEDLADWEPTFAWEAVEPTEKQLQALEKAGIDSVSVRYRGLASLILDKLHKRRDAGLATPKQIRQLEQRGFLHVGSWSLKDASSMISRIEANGWRTPPEVNPVTYDPREDELCA